METGSAFPDKGVEGDELFSDYFLNAVRELEEIVGEIPFSVPAVFSGMITSAHGWREVEYAPTPFDIDGKGYKYCRKVLPEASDFGRELFFLSGVRNEKDVMRGEETEVVGLFQHNDYEDFREGCLIVLPGTHSKHIRIEAGRIQGFQTHMTGELYVVLSEYSVLQKSLGGVSNPGFSDPRCLDALKKGIRESFQGELSSSLFQVRVNTLFQRMDALENQCFLTGLLVGHEVRGLNSDAHRLPILLAVGQEMLKAYSSAIEMFDPHVDLHIIAPEVSRDLAVFAHAAFLESCVS